MMSDLHITQYQIQFKHQFSEVSDWPVVIDVNSKSQIATIRARFISGSLTVLKACKFVMEKQPEAEHYYWQLIIGEGEDEMRFNVKFGNLWTGTFQKNDMHYELSADLIPIKRSATVKEKP